MSIEQILWNYIECVCNDQLVIMDTHMNFCFVSTFRVKVCSQHTGCWGKMTTRSPSRRWTTVSAIYQSAENTAQSAQNKALLEKKSWREVPSSSQQRIRHKMRVKMPVYVSALVCVTGSCSLHKLQGPLPWNAVRVYVRKRQRQNVALLWLKQELPAKAFFELGQLISC